MLSCVTVAHGIYALMFSKIYLFWSLKTLSSRLCQYLFISTETEEKLSNVGRI